MVGKSHTEKTSASGTIAGFDFQYYFFLYKLLNLKKGESIGFEALDDVHTELDAEHQVLIQVKHSLQKNASQNTVNLTELDTDLWKTLSNWVSIITDKNDGRLNLVAQKSFINKTSFVLASNKSFTSTNDFLRKLYQFQNNTISSDEFVKYITGLVPSTKSKEIQSYINKLLSLDVEVLPFFLMRIKTELNINNIVSNCKTALEEKHVNPSQIDTLFNQLDSIVRQDIFKHFSSGEKLIYSFDQISLKFRRYFDIANNPELKIRKFEGGLPDNLEDQTFIKQLLDIEDIEHTEKEFIEQFTRFRLLLESNLSKWVDEGQLTSEEIDTFEREIILKWETEFRAAYRGKSDPSAHIDISNDILKSMRDKEIAISGQTLLTEMAHGSLYSLSDRPLIGWLKDWKERYR